MNGAQALIRTLVDAGVDVCFMNPGTSEMHFVAALDDVPEMRGVLACSRAWPPARPTATPASRAGRPPRCCTSAPAWATGWPTSTTPAGRFTPVVNIVGDHATYHKQYDAQLESDIETVARNVSRWVRVVRQRRRASPDAADAVAAAHRAARARSPP